MRHTKIIATVGPACDSPEMITKMLLAGVNVFRFNLKHNVIEWHEERIIRVNKIAKKLGAAVGVLLDLQGCEIRIGTFEEGPLEVVEGDRITFAPQRKAGEKTIVLTDLTVLHALKVDTIVLIDDGLTKFKIVQAKRGRVVGEVLKGGVIGNNKGLNVPSLELDLPTLLDKDLQHIGLAARHSVDYIALSFVRNRNDIQILRKEMTKQGVDAKILAKIENQFAVDRFDEILDEADGIVVARGYLGVEMELYKLPIVQKMMIKKARTSGKPIITATQMMHSMLHNPTPTRAEVSDVANAVLDSSDTIWFSEETAMGKYPLEVVEMASKIAEYTEENRDLFKSIKPANVDPVAAGAYQLYQSLRNIDKKGSLPVAFVVLTESGRTARMLATFRPQIPILAVTHSESVRDKLTLSFGINPLYINFPQGTINSLKFIYKHLIAQKLLQPKDKVIIIRGLNWGEPDQTNTISLETVTV